MKYSYPAIMAIDKDSPDLINIKIPDIWGAEAFGDSEEQAIEKAKSLLTEMILIQPHLCGTPHTYEQAVEAFPTKKVVMIEVEL